MTDTICSHRASPDIQYDRLKAKIFDNLPQFLMTQNIVTIPPNQKSNIYQEI